ncbi:M17 family metallopeptidase [Candidatus Uabimicrobium sp. HlEnr_7]|uniref:leucyl aminopeptidase family protein n=1 Tax=Candidatus Uabimicrobium helgolandensis TaxID=3095367 RepID=UPI0035568643
MEVKLKKTIEKSVIAVSLTKEEHSYLEKNNNVSTLKIGIGKNKINRRQFFVIVRKIIKSAREYNFKKIAIELDDLKFNHLKMQPLELLEIVTSNLHMANFEFVEHRTPPKSGWNFVKEVHLVSSSITKAMRDGVKSGTIIGEEVNACRVMVNTPSNFLRPDSMAAQVVEKFKGTKIKVKVLGKKEIAKQKMGGILEVASGSEQHPQLMVLEYNGGGKEAPVALVGKAVTFDSGGLCLKPTPALIEMHMDMAGGAAMIHAIALAERMKLKKNIVAIIPSVENLISMTNYRPNDIITSMSGTTIEILNTDAEGRLILADGLTYAQKYYKPKCIIDAATLTGGARVALGLRATALFTNDDKLEKIFRDLGEKTGEYVWRLPLWDEYKKELKGNYSDIANIPTTSNPRYGSPITAACFLSYFIENDCPWVHLDIAPRMTTVPDENLARGASGEPVKLLLKVLEAL